MTLHHRMKALALAGLLLIPGVAAAAPTEITVRVMSKDAKFVGTSMGGVLITITDVLTGEVLARGETTGSTGDTELLMTMERGRRVPVATEKSAAFTATIEIDEPRKVEVAATGPLAQAQAANTVSATQWVVPGKHITEGDAWLIELPGFAVDVLKPPAHVRIGDLPQSIEISANVVMMCGCPIEPGGLWDADKYEVAALIKHDGRSVGTLPLTYAGSTSQFAARFEVEVPGVYEATVYAYDPNTGNTGLDRTTFIATE